MTAPYIADYSGWCISCSGPIAPGDRVVHMPCCPECRDDVLLGTCVRHADCDE